MVYFIPSKRKGAIAEPIDHRGIGVPTVGRAKTIRVLLISSDSKRLARAAESMPEYIRQIEDILANLCVKCSK